MNISSSLTRPSLVKTIQELSKYNVQMFSVPSNPLGIPHQCNLEFYQQALSPNPTLLHVTTRNYIKWELYRNALKHRFLVMPPCQKTDSSEHFGIEERLIKIHRAGLRNILVILGDVAQKATGPLLDSTEVIWLIKQRLNKGITSSGRLLEEPTCFTVGCAVNSTPVQQSGMKEEPIFQLQRLSEKEKAGADYAISQPVFDARAAIHFLQSYTKMARNLTPIPIFCGLLPIRNLKQLAYLSKIPGINIPSAVQDRLTKAKNEEEFQQISLEITNKIHEELSPLVKGFHLVAGSSRLDMVLRFLSSLPSSKRMQYFVEVVPPRDQ